MVKAARNHRISSSYLPAIYCGITLFDALDNYFNIYATKESTWGSLITCTFVVHPKRMYPGTYEEVDFSLKRAFPRLFKLHIRVHRRQIIKEMYILRYGHLVRKTLLPSEIGQVHHLLYMTDLAKFFPKSHGHSQHMA